MPNAAATDTKDASSEDKNPPDLVGEELADTAEIWRVYDRVAKEDDERRTKEWDNGLNNLALFAGLFSGVTTAFIIEARQDMEPDYAQLTFLAANATSYGEKFVQTPFVIPRNARTVTCLWVASLILSLSAALIAIMGKDWIGMYTARPVCNLRQWAEIRTYRLRCVEGWYMSGVIAAAPVLLHVSLILFGAGLVLFISSDPLTRHLTLGLSLAAGGLYLVTTLSALVFSTSPFKSPATQMARAALSALYSHISSISHWQQRSMIRTLLCEIHTMEFPAGPAFLPGGARENIQWYAALRQEAVRRGKSGIAYLRSIPTRVYTVRDSPPWSRVRSWMYSMVFSAHRIQFGKLILSLTWTALPVFPRPELLAGALSWLGSASQDPAVFRAIVFALGDVDVGREVSKHTSPALIMRIRTELRRTWRQVDFLTLSRYFLADRNILANQNTPGSPVLDDAQFRHRFDLSRDSALSCENGLALVIMVDPGLVLPGDLMRYSPDQMAQPRMFEFLQSHMQASHTDSLILLSHRYRTYLWTTNSFNLGKLEAHLYKTLDARTCDAYATAVTVKYGGTAGAIELLTFLCCHGVIEDNTKPAAVELIMELLPRLPVARENRCLVYLFESTELWAAAWKDKHWTGWSLFGLSRSLELFCLHPFGPSAVRTLSDDHQFDLALARIAVKMLSPQYSAFGREPYWIEFLLGHLSQSPSASLMDDSGRLDLIRIILDSAALLRIAGAYNRDAIILGVAILAAIISDVSRRLRDLDTMHDGEQLFSALSYTEATGPDGETRIWDLGEWLRTQAPMILKRSPSSTTAMEDVHDALCAIYPLCHSNHELHACWDRIGYPGRPGDIFSYPFLDIGAFFEMAEDEDGLRSGVQVRRRRLSQHG